MPSRALVPIVRKRFALRFPLFFPPAIASKIRTLTKFPPSRSIIHHPSSIIHHPSSIIHHPSSIILFFRVGHSLTWLLCEDRGRNESSPRSIPISKDRKPSWHGHPAHVFLDFRRRSGDSLLVRKNIPRLLLSSRAPRGYKNRMSCPAR